MAEQKKESSMHEKPGEEWKFSIGAYERRQNRKDPITNKCVRKEGDFFDALLSVKMDVTERQETAQALKEMD